MSPFLNTGIIIIPNFKKPGNLQITDSLTNTRIGQKKYFININTKI